MRAATGNLRPTAPGEWESPIIVSSAEGAFENTSLSVSGDYYVSWAVTNEGESDIDGLFFVDLYFDGVMVERWTNNGLPAGFTGSFPDWDGLGNRVRLQPGTHMLKLVVDSTRIILETDESDNVYEREFAWEPPAEPSTEPIQAASRLPDLAPYAPEGWDSPLTATSYPGETASGPLSVNVPAYIRFSIINQGLSSFAEDVWVHLYLDGVLVRDSRWSGAMLGQTLVSSQWDELYSVTNVGAGEHTLKLAIDPNNLVKESDESNNTLELPLTWDTGPVPPLVVTASPKPEAPYPLFLPNLVPGWTHGEDGPIVISHDKGSSQDSLLTVDETPYVDIAVHNQSLHPVEDFFVVELYFDDLNVHTFEVRGGIPPTRVFKVLDWNQLAQMAPLGVGEHTIRMVIDPDDRIWEEFEDDNVYEKTFVWSNGELPETEPVTYTDEQLEAMLAGLPRLLDLRESALGPDGVDHTANVMEIAEAGYYLVTGKSLEDERVAVLFLTHGDYVNWIDEHYSAVFAVRDDLDYPEILRARESFKKANGFKTRRFGKVALVINAERQVGEVLSTLAHELGHLRQDTLNPRQSEIDQLYVINALQEAQAQQFERVFWLSVEEFTSLSLMQYPDYEGFHRYIDSQLERWVQESDQDEHLMGFLLQWLAVLDDPELAYLRNELESTGRLGMESSQELFKYLVDMSPGVAALYVETRLEVMEAHLDTISAIARERLVTRLHPDNEGPPALTVPGLLVP